MFVGLAAAGLLGLWYVKQQVVINTPPPTRVASNARILVEPSSGAPGIPLRVTGRDWQAGDVVFVSLEAPFSTSNRDFAYAGAVVDDKGQFQVSFTFPQEERWTSAGAVKVVAWAEQSGSKAVTIFQVIREVLALSTLSNNSELTPTILDPAHTAQATPSPLPQPTPSATPTSTAMPILPAENWYGEYFSGLTLSNSPVFLRNDREIHFDWGEGSPGEKLDADRFSVRWARNTHFTAGAYRFFAQADDGVRLWVDDKLVIDQWHEGSTTTYVADAYLWEGEHHLKLEYYELDGKASVRLWWEKLDVFSDWKGEYFNNSRLAGQPALVRNDLQVRFNWGSQSPAPGIRVDDFSARWTRRVRFEQGRFRFYIHSDGGMRVWLDNTLVIDLWQSASSGLRTTDLSLESGEYRVQVEYYNDTGAARAEIWWELLAITPTAYPLTPPDAQMAAVSPPTIEIPQIVQAQADSVEPTATTLLPKNVAQQVIVVPLPATMVVPTPTIPSEPSVSPSPMADVSLALTFSGRPVLEVDPLEAVPGAEVTVRGRGWPSGEEVVIALVEPGADPVQAPPAANVAVDTGGLFEVRLLIPTGAKWQDDSELIVLAHTVDWMTRLVTPLYIALPTPINNLRPIDQP